MSTHSKKYPNRRTKLLIEPKFQIGFLIHTLSGALVSSGIFYIANRLFFWKFADYGKIAGLAPDHIFFKFLEAQQSQMNQIFIGTMLLVCAMLIAYGLAYSNRIAGPIYHLRKYLKAYALGKTEFPLKLRNTDLFEDLGPMVNDALQTARSENVEKKVS